MRQVSRAHHQARGGIRADIGIYVRSSWEANIARYLDWLISNKQIYRWEYESDEFEFPVRRGARFYRPDFKIWDQENSKPYYWEVKGYMDSKSKTKLKRMRKYYPEVKIVLVDREQYRAIEKDVADLIPGWEISAAPR